MAFSVRVVALSAGLATLIAGLLATPSLVQVFASEPQSHVLDSASDLFFTPPAFDPKLFKKFEIKVDPAMVSTKVRSSQVVSKIAFGHRTSVAIVTTSSGVYSSDGLASPYVRYPGIEVLPRDEAEPSLWFGTSTTPYGTSTWTRIDTGSFTYLNSTRSAARRH